MTDPETEARMRIVAHETPLAGYTFCWDNVQVMGHTKHQTSSATNPFILLAMCFATQNRVPTIGQDEEDSIPAMQLPATALLPTAAAHHRRVQRAVHIVQRILVDLFPVLQKHLGADLSFAI